MNKNSLLSVGLGAFALLLSGCAAPPAANNQGSAASPTYGAASSGAAQPAAAAPAPASAAAPKQAVVPVEPSASEKQLATALATYDRGEYAAAIRLLAPLTTDSAQDLTGQLQALKTLAFSQCLTNALTACRQSFERAFKLDPKFDLAPAERGHPVWGPQFERAKKAAAAQKAK
jgi:hypothetical protein